jgi:hypothetical protein
MSLPSAMKTTGDGGSNRCACKLVTASQEGVGSYFIEMYGGMLFNSVNKSNVLIEHVRK